MGGRWFGGQGGVFSPVPLVCHCLLLETKDGLALVDTGFGTEDVQRAKERLGGQFLAGMRPALDASECAIRQVERLGFRREDVRHIALTHLDLDHAGGLSDFPEAEVHVMAPELAAASERRGVFARSRYRPSQWAHAPKWRLHEGGGDAWFGFESVRALGGDDDEVLLVPLAGHSRGHAAVAVKDGAGWLLHAGDAYFFHGEIELAGPVCPPGLSFFQRVMAVDDAARRHNQARLRALATEHGSAVRIVCSHSPVEFVRETARAPEKTSA